jgi:membrane associated rhomboid family serine protease
MRPPESWHSAKVTLWVAGVTAVAWLLVSTLGQEQFAAIWGGFIPLRVGGLEGDSALAPVILTPLTATLIHGNFAHLAFNLLILLFCGRSVETIIGSRSFIILYVLGAYAAAAAQYLAGPQETTPMVGASGAISAVIGAYAIMFGKNRVKVAHPTLALWLNALWLAAAWIGLQLLVGLTFRTAGPQVAIAAHIGGFLIGLMLAKPLLLFRYRTA